MNDYNMLPIIIVMYHIILRLKFCMVQYVLYLYLYWTSGIFQYIFSIKCGVDDIIKAVTHDDWPDDLRVT